MALNHAFPCRALNGERGWEFGAADDSALCVYIACLVALRQKSKLFYASHRLIEDFPNRAVSWYAVGAYYFCLQKYENARKHFTKATSIDPKFAAAWVGYGHSFAAQDEADQAMTAYRTAMRLADGSHVPWLCVGMEYARTSNLFLAEKHMLRALDICPSDPLVYNELAMLKYEIREYAEAQLLLERGLSFVDKAGEVSKETQVLYYNLAQILRKRGLYQHAIHWFSACLALTPHSAVIMASLGLAYHANGQLDEAIQQYHQALGVKPEDTLINTLLNKALQELFFVPPPSSSDPSSSNTDPRFLPEGSPVTASSSSGEPATPLEQKFPSRLFVQDTPTLVSDSVGDE